MCCRSRVCVCGRSWVCVWQVQGLCGRSRVCAWQAGLGFGCGRSKVWGWQVKGLCVAGAGQGFGCGRLRVFPPATCGRSTCHVQRVSPATRGSYKSSLFLLSNCSFFWRGLDNYVFFWLDCSFLSLSGLNICFLTWCLIDLSLFGVFFVFPFGYQDILFSIDMLFRLFLFGFDFDVDTASEEL